MEKGYINHYEMKKARLEVMEECNYTCKMCGGEARIIHHIDGSKINHNKENLMPVCDKCHCKIHHDTNKVDVPKLNTDKINSLIALKGLSKKTFAERIGISSSSFSILLNKKRTKSETVQKMADVLDVEISELFTEEYMQRLENTEFRHYGGTIRSDGAIVNKPKKTVVVTLRIPVKVYDAIWTNSQNPMRKVFRKADKYIENILWDKAVKEVGNYKLLMPDEEELDCASGIIERLKGDK